MVTTDRQSVAEFLDSLREVLGAGGKLIVVPREKNRESLLRLGLTFGNCRQELLTLTELNYCSGPDQDADPAKKGDVWVFGKEIDGCPVYIKVKVTKGWPGAVTCISFHEAEARLKFVYK